MTSSDREQKPISAEQQHISLKMQQLLDKKKMLCIIQELRKRAEFGQADDMKDTMQETHEETVSNQQQIDGIDAELKELSEKMAELQQTYDNILPAKKDCGFTSSINKEPGVPVLGSNTFHIEDPPKFPAPAVILDLDKLPPWPCRTQCPDCRQFIMTETFTSVSSLTWLVCLITALSGCVAGCCLLPFCFDTFKSITHRCPNCRSSIKTIKKL